MGIEKLKTAAIVVGAVAVIDLMAIAVIVGFKNTGLVDNNTADAFISGLAIFGTLITLPVLGMIGKILIDFFRK